MAVNRWYQLPRITDVVEAISGFRKPKRLYKVHNIGVFWQRAITFDDLIFSGAS